MSNERLPIPKFIKIPLIGITPNDAQRSFVFERGDPQCNSGKVTVVSYEQSDFFAMQ